MCEYFRLTRAEPPTATTIHLAYLALSGRGAAVHRSHRGRGRLRRTSRATWAWSDETEARARPRGAWRYLPTGLVALLGDTPAARRPAGAPWDGGQLVPPEQGGCRRRHRRQPTMLPSLRRARWTPPWSGAVRNVFVDSACCAIRLGFDATELHGGPRLPAAPVPAAAGRPRDDDYGLA